jgi:hypothetical protein
VPDGAYRGYARTLVLGDIPLPGVEGQVVLVHQPHLIHPRISGVRSPSRKYAVMRWTFRRNLRFVKAAVVQTESMREQLVASYPELRDRVTVIPQPVPHWFGVAPRFTARVGTPALRLFYPAAGYPHKNHGLFTRMDTVRDGASPVEIVVTLGEGNAALPSPPAWVRDVGRLDPEECMVWYRGVDALFFPSLLESYGLPLVEAMTMGLPIVCADLPYARWLCGEGGIYFDPRNAESAWQAIRELEQRLAHGWAPDWSTALSRLPRDWKHVATQFVDLLGPAHPARPRSSAHDR